MMEVEAGDPILPAWENESVEKPRRWLKIPERSVNQFKFGKVMDHLYDAFESKPVASGLEMHRIFLWDNLIVNKTYYATHQISAAPSMIFLRRLICLSTCQRLR